MYLEMHGTLPIVVSKCFAVNGSFTTDVTIHVFCLLLLKLSQFVLYSDSDDKPRLLCAAVVSEGQIHSHYNTLYLFYYNVSLLLLFYEAVVCLCLFFCMHMQTLEVNMDSLKDQCVGFPCLTFFFLRLI